MPLLTGLGKDFLVSPATLDLLKDHSMADICHNGFAKVQKGHSHCAHFVSHVLGVQVGGTCRNMGTKAGSWGVTMRVNELFEACPTRGFWANRPPALVTCLAFVLLHQHKQGKKWRSVMSGDGQRMTGHVRERHVGIHHGGNVWHFHNGQNKVVCQPLATFEKRYSKHAQPYDLLFGSFPSRIA